MKRIFLFAAIASVFVCAPFAGTLSAQETEVEPRQEVADPVIDADNPGIGQLDQATDAKLRASTILDLSQVIVLCQRAKKSGLSGENLEYCNQLLASTQLQRGLFLANSLLNPNNPRPGNWETLRQAALVDLEEAVAVIKDQPNAYIQIALLNHPDGNEDRAKEALDLAISSSKDEPALQIRAVRMRADLEEDVEKRSAILAASKDGNPQIQLDYVALLLELKRNDEALNVLKNLIESESDNVELHDRIVTILSRSREHAFSIEVLDMLRQKVSGEEADSRKDRIDLVRVEVLTKMERLDEALKLLEPLHKKYQEQTDMTLLTLMLRSGIYFAMEKFDEALKDIEIAEKTAPNFSALWEQKYRILMEQEKFIDALEVVKRLKTIEPDVLLYFFWEIHVLSEMQKYDEALKVVQDLRKEHPNEESLWMMTLVDIYAKKKEYDKAMTLVEEQLKADPDALRWIVNKTQILSVQKKWDEATNWLELCLEKKKDSEEITLLLIGVLTDKKSFKAAKEHIKPLIEKRPNDPTLLRIDSQLSISLGLHDEAGKALEKVVEADPTDYTSLNNLAWLLSTSPIDSVRNGRRAVELAEKAGKLSRYKRAFILSTLAAAYAEAGDFVKAREWSQKSIEIAKTEKKQTDEERQELLEHLQKEWDTFKREEPFRELLLEGVE